MYVHMHLHTFIYIYIIHTHIHHTSYIYIYRYYYMCKYICMCITYTHMYIYIYICRLVPENSPNDAHSGTVEARKLKHEGPRTPNRRKAENQHKSSYIHVPSFWSPLQVVKKACGWESEGV